MFVVKTKTRLLTKAVYEPNYQTKYIILQNVNVSRKKSVGFDRSNPKPLQRYMAEGVETISTPDVLNV